MARMTRAEINETVTKVIELLHAAQPGQGTATERAEARDKANALIQTLPARWWRKAPESLTSQLTALA